MRGAVLHGPRDVRFEQRDAPTILEATDAIIRIAATCVCGSDLWPYRGLQPINGPTPMGHEYCGIVEEVGGAVRSVKPGQFVIGSFAISDNTCPTCQYGYQSSCMHREFISRAQAPVLRVPMADGTLVPTPGVPSDDLAPSLLRIIGCAGRRLVRRRRRQREAGINRRGGRRRRRRPARCALGEADGAQRIIAMSRHESGRSSRASSVRPTSSPSAVTKASPASRI